MGCYLFNDSLAISDQWQITPIVRIGANKGYLIFLFILRSPQIPLCFLFSILSCCLLTTSRKDNGTSCNSRIILFYKCRIISVMGCNITMLRHSDIMILHPDWMVKLEIYFGSFYQIMQINACLWKINIKKITLKANYRLICFSCISCQSCFAALLHIKIFYLFSKPLQRFSQLLCKCI